ncbi:hypothetical protein [Candidatus Electronema sp. TJ]|uniref:hypothetical protein n=1 Tax=Candidatus Electronema sp. TJ TaxID=3401573 RepID=UPI003AA9B9E9
MCICDCTLAKSGIDILKVAKFEPIKQIIREKGLAHVNDQSNLMFCSPVGNQKLFSSEVKANIVLSGFCVAPDAAIAFAEDLQRMSFKEATVANTFNTPTMRNGIKKIFKSIGIRNEALFEESTQGGGLAESAIRLLMTQMLCVISKNGGSKATDVIELLKSNLKIRGLAERCLCCWVKRIEEKVEPGGIILLMGGDSLKLIADTEFRQGAVCRCVIRLNEQMKGSSLLSYLEKKSYTVVPVIHAAGIGYPNSEAAWYKKAERAAAHRLLLEKFGGDAIEEQLTA